MATILVIDDDDTVRLSVKLALEDAGIERKDLDASVIGSVPEYHKQRSVAGVVQEYLNLNPRPTWLTEVACASGSAAIRTAWMAIQSGLHEVVERLSIPGARVSDSVLARLSDTDAPQGVIARLLASARALGIQVPGTVSPSRGGGEGDGQERSQG